ncbi:hypothetical protein C1645_770193 [Glomus cerebriforme]|uniref:HMG box domain-containing protein n=1 Tax=Glomus cerebriforme TaxID=658196 RepID=A0A397T082_9GLOM|nr:hypothetical protein C1645_770193 [Glomus cerebriforme]
MPKSMPKNIRENFKSNQKSKSNSTSFIISSHLSQFRRIHKIFPTNLSLEKLLTPSNIKPPRKKTFSLRPPNGFILYRKDIQQEIMKNNPDVTFKTVSVIASKKWKCETEEIKNFFNSLSKVAHLVYLDICEIYVEQNKEHININLYEMENNKDDEKKNLDRPWMQSSIYPTMFVTPNSEKISGKKELQKIELNDDDNNFINDPSIPSSYNLLDFDQQIFHSSIPSLSKTSTFSSFTTDDSANYYLEFPHITDSLLNNNDNPYQIPSQLYHAGNDELTMNFDYGNGNNDYLYIFNNQNSFFTQ